MGKTPNSIYPNQTPLDVVDVLRCFNEKFSYIFKYLSKELGPVAFNAMKKCWQETKPHLSSLWQKSKITASGQLDLSHLLKTNLVYTDAKIQAELIRDLNEILVAEVLVIRKNLGSDHETILVQNLEKIGEKS
ncbi:MAG: hypothetical protein ACE5GI_01530 [Candidatus Aminicenantales bacterium]